MSKKISRKKFIQNSAIGLLGAYTLPKTFLNNYNQKLTGESKIMDYEWIFNKRPYSDEEAKTLLADVIDAETSDWHYNTHHKGYVTALNTIEKALQTADKSKANGNYSDYGELKRRFTWNHAGTVLHDLYWENLGGDGDISKAPEIQIAINDNFGSFDNWKADFKAACMSAKLSGWGVLTLDTLYSGRLINVMADEHHYGAIWGGIPLVACDVFEHAYYHKDGPGRAKYIDNFINHINWSRVNDRFKKYS
ncbi:MAG TPA: hypothetical protein DEP28_01300 [Bacteroidetes bacterium]|nr:hypothetical protein [Bacteroidota bacterium]HCN36890.1 hypothetical protein [Bacteroidota bacterium]